jgi:hypothetical protein
VADAGIVKLLPDLGNISYDACADRSQALTPEALATGHPGL